MTKIIIALGLLISIYLIFYKQNNIEVTGQTIDKPVNNTVNPYGIKISPTIPHTTDITASSMGMQYNMPHCQNVAVNHYLRCD